MMIKPSFLVLSYSCELLKRKHRMSKYIGVEGLDFVSIPKYKQQSNSFFKFIPVNNDILCQHSSVPYSPNQKIVLLFQRFYGKTCHNFLVRNF